MKKILSIILSFFIVITIAYPIFTFANVKEYSAKAELLQEDNYSFIKYSNKYLSLSPATYENLVFNIKSSLLNYSSSFSIAGFKLSEEEAQLVYANVINDNPELFYVASSYSYYYNASGGYVTTIKPAYVMSKNDVEDAKIIYNLGMKKALAQVDDSMTDVQKALVIHDYLCNIATYPDLGTNQVNDRDIYHSAYGIFFDGKTVCAGYALTYSAILKELGIPSKYVVSNDMGHAWNAIYVNDHWYNVDLTFDDIQYKKEQNWLGTFLHNCFLRSDEGLQSLDGAAHYSIIYPDGVECNDTTYDDYFWKGVNTNICVVDGNYYYLNYDNSNRRISVIKRDLQGNEEIISGSKSYMAFYSALSSTTRLGTLTYIIPFSKLIRINNYLYFSNYTTETIITAINLDNYCNMYIKSHSGYNNVLGVIDGDMVYSDYAERNNPVYHHFDRRQEFDEAYSSGVYSPYADTNKDLCINAKDYAYIINDQKHK